MQFQYTAINNENKKLNGFINAENEEDARNQLNNLGLAVLGIELKDSEDTEDEEKLKFEALDKNGKKIIGTIPSTDKNEAFKRLIEEYNFQILALYKLDATEEEKELSRTEIGALQNNYELKKAEEATPGILTEEEKKVKEELLNEVKFVITKVNEILEKFTDEIKPAEIKNIEAMRDKLLRLKSSNNLNFIKQTCEELLKIIQKKEIYLHQDQFVQGRERIKLETQKLLLEIHKLDTSPNVDLFSDESSFRKIKEKFFKTKAVSEEKTTLKAQIREIQSQLFDYYRIWLKASRSMKPEIKNKIRELSASKRELKASLKSVAKEERLKSKTHKVSTLEPDLIIITGWLLTFYLGYYFLNYYLTFKTSFLNRNFSFQSNIFESPVFTYLILGIFLLHIILQTKQMFLRQNRAFNYIAYPLLLITIVLININF
ncbi:hypothetical protein HOG48_03600 [Candidatus Peregrinibacteria bacterium]|jgi:hypothetical protein|nr:hypothetical protein [Candidatus Peregrinibacteria bacterium]